MAVFSPAALGFMCYIGAIVTYGFVYSAFLSIRPRLSSQLRSSQNCRFASSNTSMAFSRSLTWFVMLIKELDVIRDTSCHLPKQSFRHIASGTTPQLLRSFCGPYDDVC